jgi:hypothetical protein
MINKHPIALRLQRQRIRLGFRNVNRMFVFGKGHGFWLQRWNKEFFPQRKNILLRLQAASLTTGHPLFR